MDYVLSAASRELTGKRVKRLRHDKQVPAVLYGHGVAPTSLAIARGELEKVYRQAGGSSVISLKLADGKERNVLIYQVQQLPTTGQLMHVDFYQVRMDEEITATVPLLFEGTAPAVREQNGTLATNLAELEVQCLPKDLPHDLTVTIDSLTTFEDSITVADLDLPAGVTPTLDPETMVASVTPPRSDEELDELEEAPEAVDPESIEATEEGPAEGTDEQSEPSDGEER